MKLQLIHRPLGVVKTTITHITANRSAAPPKCQGIAAGCRRESLCTPVTEGHQGRGEEQR